ncbi:hypothetical protein MMC25_001179 [Agyrium rufum]|nr:hypothetical protein [Agyrium rufum]
MDIESRFQEMTLNYTKQPSQQPSKRSRKRKSKTEPQDLHQNHHEIHHQDPVPSDADLRSPLEPRKFGDPSQSLNATAPIHYPSRTAPLGSFIHPELVSGGGSQKLLSARLVSSTERETVPEVFPHRRRPIPGSTEHTRTIHLANPASAQDSSPQRRPELLPDGGVALPSEPPKDRWHGLPPSSSPQSPSISPTPSQTQTPRRSARIAALTSLSPSSSFSSSSKSPRSSPFPISPKKAPVPTEAYTNQASREPKRLTHPQKLLLVLDLNGTLVARKRGRPIVYPRPYLDAFLTYCLAEHKVLVWSSARPENVEAMCKQIFESHGTCVGHETDSGESRSYTRRMTRSSTATLSDILLGQWGRNTLGLSRAEYKEKVQVYKRLETVWNDQHVQAGYPPASPHVTADILPPSTQVDVSPKDTAQGKWSQANTLLIDDSVLKACAQPYNHIEIPEFLIDSGGRLSENVDDEFVGGGGKTVLGQVVGYLEECKYWDDVSGFVRKKPFRHADGWGL